MPSNSSSPRAITHLINQAIGQEAGERTFHPFIKLPVELQLIIWRRSLPEEGRVVEIVWTGQWWSPLESAASANAMLSVCKQSRKEYQKHYKHLCHLAPADYYHKFTGQGVHLNHCSSSNTDMSDYPKCFFNPEIDTLYFSFSSQGQFRLVDTADDFGSNMCFQPTILNSLTSNEFFPQPKIIACEGCELFDWLILSEPKYAYSNFEAGSGRARDQKDFLKVMKTIFPRLETVIIVMLDVYWVEISQGNLFRFSGEITWEVMDSWTSWDWRGRGEEDDGVEGDVRENGEIVTAYDVDLVWRGALRDGKSLDDLASKYLDNWPSFSSGLTNY